MGLWFWLFVAYKFISCTSPFTSPIGSAFGFLSLIASFVFVILTFFFAPHWWYGLYTIGAMMLVLLVTPRIDPSECTPGQRIYSMVASHFLPVLIVLAYLSLFGVI